MKATNDVEQIIKKLKILPLAQRTEVADFVDFLGTKSRKLAALERLLTIAPALEKAGAAPINEDDIMTEIKASRTERRSRKNVTTD